MFLLSLLRRTHSAVVVRTTLLATAALLCFWACAARSADDGAYAQAVTQLATQSFKDKEAAVASLAAGHHPNALAVFKALLEGNLYYRRDDRRVFIAQTAGEALTLTDPIAQKAVGTGDPAEYSKITTNNQLRKALRGAIAALQLSDSDSAVRLAAVKEMLRSMDEESAAILRARVGQEKDGEVAAAIRAALALADLGSEQSATRLAAVESLAGNLSPDVYNRLTTMVQRGEDGSYGEPDETVRIAAIKAINSIESWRSFYGVIETLFFGLSLGSVLVLAAIGLAITFGVMGVINMAHGELMMLGAYTTYVMQLLMPAAHRRFDSRRDPGRLLSSRRRRHPHRARRRALPLRPAARNSARDIRCQPAPAAGRARRFHANNRPVETPHGWRARCRSTRRSRLPTTASTWSCSCSSCSACC